MKLSGWGRYPQLKARVLAPRSIEELRALVQSEPNLIARGNGRAYGDCAINSKATIETRRLNRMESFDSESGMLVAEAGVLLGDIVDTFLPAGYFPLVTPGTKFVTLGGAIAADVHGKNHHIEGSFRACVNWVDVLNADGGILRCSSQENSDLFDYTLGGMGLTGVILRAAITLRRVETAWIRQTTYTASTLRSAMDTFENALDATYSVAWIDSLAKGPNLGRSLIMLGEHASLDELPSEKAATPYSIPAKRKLAVLIDFPGFFMNQFVVWAFNKLYYWIGKRRTGMKLVDWDSYFYPLDGISDWNKICGRKGFAQFQCVIPLERSEQGLKAILQKISTSGAGSFLAVLKRFGKQQSPFSFPMEGYTLALDFPISPKKLALLEELDRIVLEHGGRFYLAKDSRMSADTFAQSDERASVFHKLRKNKDWADKFSSAQSERLTL